MLITDPKKLAQALLPILRDKVVVRYEYHERFYETGLEADIIALPVHKGRTYLARLPISVTIGREICIESPGFTVMDYDDVVPPLEDVLTKWCGKVFDDWLHDEQFKGAMIICSGGRPLTSVEMAAQWTHWQFLTGTIVGQLQGLCESLPRGSCTAQVLHVLRKRFCGFALQSQRRWADR